MNRRITAIQIVALSSCWVISVCVADPGAHFDRVVAPVLAGRCLDCHSGPEPKGELDLSRRETAFAGGESGRVMDPGVPEQSLLWELVNGDEMPPKHPLPEAEKNILRDWIAAGAGWGADPIEPFRYSSAGRAGYDWWSLQPLTNAQPPEVANDHWSRNEIDRFVLASLESEGWSPAPRADPRTLVRRLYFDLHGLPAPLEIIERFAADPSQEKWVRLVDEVLTSPHYGERWARHWLDVARFGESGGYEYNKPRESAWHYRDWLIRALNDDLPYDQFARMQLAGDLLKPGSVEGAAAVGFLVAGVHNDVLGKSPKMKMAGRQDELEEIAATVGQTFLGMTVHCARCHDHKFDPISTREYYQFIAALDGVKHGKRKLGKDRDSDDGWHELAEHKDELERQMIDLVAARGGELVTSANIVELLEPIEANQHGRSYRVSLKLAPTVWAAPSQATGESDGVVVRLVGMGGGVQASHFFKAQAWAGEGNAERFEAGEFHYEGDGSGPVRIRIEPHPLNSGRFGGAVDDLQVRQGTELVFEERFDRLEQTQPPGTQADTQRRVFHSAKSETWTHRGVNSLHAVEHGEGNFALQLFGGSGGAAVTPVTPEERQIQSEIARLGHAITGAQARAFKEVFTVIARNPGPCGCMSAAT